MADSIRRWASSHGGTPPRANDWRSVRDPEFVEHEGAGWPSYLSAIRASPDGTWDGMLAYAGFRPRGRGRPPVAKEASRDT